MHAGDSGAAVSSDYCYVCDAMRTAVSENRYLRQVHEQDEQERCAARKRMGLEGMD
jgi:Arc/MetJ family transcription regulator